MKKPRKQRRKVRQEALVLGHLERVSRRLLEEHFDVVRRFIGRSSGIYVLYRKERLYYVGLASGLSGRLKAHIRDHHKASWDRFSIYLTIRDQHVKELESLLLRITRPNGNRVSGRVAGSKDLRQRLQQAIKQQQRQEILGLFARTSKTEKATKPRARDADQQKLTRLFPEGARIRGTQRQASWRATVRRDGCIRFNGEIYGSLSAAAKVAVKRSAVNGWWFWQVERSKGHWIRLQEARRIGTPIYRTK